MEFINKIELRGVVGRADVNSYNGNRVINFTLITEYSARDKEGNATTEATWFNISYWEGRDPSVPAEVLDQIGKGSWVHLVGRLRTRNYTTVDNEEKTALDVIAQSIKLVERDDPFMQPQRD